MLDHTLSSARALFICAFGCTAFGMVATFAADADAPSPIGSTNAAAAPDSQNEQPTETTASKPAPNARQNADAAKSHWSFQPLNVVEPPAVHDTAWVQNAIDHFVLARLEHEQLAPARRADKATLLRRLYIDLTGLPPTLEQTEAFLSDTAPDAYERLVNRLLDSPHYAERWTRHWLDQARFADSHGYDIDHPRPNAWRYRDWVLDAIQRDMPFDQFTIEQIAGDLLPNATVNQRTATAFHRNSLHNTEAGADEEEDRVRQTLDRTNTIATVWLGLTLACAQCHDHKYDPISQKEYFGFYAFMNGVSDIEITSPTPRDQLKYEIELPLIEGMLDVTKDMRRRYEDAIAKNQQQQWEASFKEIPVGAWSTLDLVDAIGSKGEDLVLQEDQSLLVQGPLSDDSTYTIVFAPEMDRITALRLEVLPDDSFPRGGPGRSPTGRFNLCSIVAKVENRDYGDDQPADPNMSNDNIVDTSVELEFVQHVASHSSNDTAFDRCIGDRGQTSGWSNGEITGQRLVAFLELHEPIVDARKKKITITMRQGGANWMQMIGRFRWSASSTPTPFVVDELPNTAGTALKIPADQRTEQQQTTVRQYFCARDQYWAQLTNLLRKRMEYAPKNPDEVKADVVQAPATPPKTCVFIKGEFYQLGEEVQPHTPSCLPPLVARGEQPDRLDLANWIASSQHPLTARVAVNRVWQKYFGRGLVVTDDDFGMLGTQPTHPELLDWLADDFIASGWSVKALHRRIVMSATYQQSSVYRADLVEVDPDNELLARQNRIRFDAEIVRDAVLSVSGLLVPDIGGKSLVQPQPFGNADLAFNRSQPMKPDWGSGLFRRGMYVWHQRTAPYPMLNIFDVPNGNLTCTRRVRSNTPMQALMRLNDATQYECARALARKLMDEVPGATGDKEAVTKRINTLFATCLARQPSPEEVERFEFFHSFHVEFYETYPDLALTIVRRFVKEDEPIALSELATWSVLTRIMFNLEEFIVRE